MQLDQSARYARTLPLMRGVINQMKIIEMFAIIFAVISGGCLASIQIRRIIKGELSPFGTKAFTSAFQINLDSFDKRMLIISGISFVIFIGLMLLNYS
jgi:hypothetical protein